MWRTAMRVSSGHASVSEGIGNRGIVSPLPKYRTFHPKKGIGCAHDRSALGRRFEGGEGLGQHAFGVARPLVQLFLGVVTPPWREFFHIPYFRYPRAAPAGL